MVNESSYACDFPRCATQDTKQCLGPCNRVMLPGVGDAAAALMRERLPEAIKPAHRIHLAVEVWTNAARHPPAPAAPPPSSKLSNPKDVIGSDKLPLHLWPETASAMGCVALAEGMLKYGRANWRHAGVRASIYVDACRRHMAAWFEGEDTAPDSGVPHLANALACLAILVDAQAAGKLVDDRQTPGGYRALVENLTPHITRLKALHADKNPRHYTIADGEQP